MGSRSLVVLWGLGCSSPSGLHDRLMRTLTRQAIMIVADKVIGAICWVCGFIYPLNGATDRANLFYVLGSEEFHYRLT